MNTDIPTPRTEKMIQAVGSYSVQVATTGELAPSTELADSFEDIRQLERELGEANRLIAELRSTPINAIHAAKLVTEWMECENERDQFKQRVESLVKAGEGLNQIVEGVMSTRWSNGNMRFKDSVQWCHFYSTLARAKDAMQNEKSK
jgi:hypothetical protein